MLKLNITPKAESDLIGIWMYTCEEGGVDQADKYLDQLETGMKQLINHPSLGANYAHVFPGYRRLQVEHHATFYQVLDPMPPDGGGKDVTSLVTLLKKWRDRNAAAIVLLAGMEKRIKPV